MALEPLDIQPWVDRLKSNISALRHVGRAASLYRLNDNLRQTPAVYIMPGKDNPGKISDTTATIDQQLTAVVDVYVVVQNRRDSVGEKSLDDLRALRKEVMAQLIGWSAPGAFDAVHYGGGNFVEMNDTALIWREQFTAPWRLNV